MSEKPPTRKEHETRAMLLGLHYDWRDGTYCTLGGDGLPVCNNRMIDCLTLEPMDANAGIERRQSVGVSPSANWRETMRTVPWETPDEKTDA